MENAPMIWQTCKRLYADDRGLEVVEYAIIAGLIVVGALAALTGIGLWVFNILTQARTALGP